MIRVGIGVQGFVSAGAGTDADAQAFIDAAGITDATQQSAINTLVTDLKGYGIWSKMKAIYPFVGGTSSTHKWNLKDPRDLDAAFRLVFSGGWTHSSTGALPNGTNGYADTFVNNNTNLQQNSVSHGIYSRTTTISNSIISGLGTNTLLTLGKTTSSSIGLYSQIQTSGPDYINYNSANDLGFLIGNRTSSTSVKLYLNGIKQVDTTKNSLPKESLNYFIGARNNNGVASTFTNAQLAFSFIGDGLTDTEAANLYSAVQAFQTTLNRQIEP